MLSTTGRTDKVLVASPRPQLCQNRAFGIVENSPEPTFHGGLMSHNLPSSLHVTILSYLPYYDLVRHCSLVNRGWYQVVSRCMEKELSQQNRQQWQATYDRRCHVRNCLSETERQSLDQDFANAITNELSVVATKVEDCTERKRQENKAGKCHYLIRSLEMVRHFLDRGATASRLPYFRRKGLSNRNRTDNDDDDDGDDDVNQMDEVYDKDRHWDTEPNVAGFCEYLPVNSWPDFFYFNNKDHISRRQCDTLKILEEFAASPCISWHHHCAVTGGDSLPAFINETQTVSKMVLHCALGNSLEPRLDGDVGVRDTTPTMLAQYQAFKVFCRIVWVSARQKDGIARLLEDIGCLATHRVDKKGTKLHFVLQILKLLLEHCDSGDSNVKSVLDLVWRPLDIWWHDKYVAGLVLLIPKFVMYLLKDADEESYRDRLDWPIVLGFFWSDRQYIRLFYSLLRRDHDVRLLLIRRGGHDDVVWRKLCQRKDRRALELLVLLEPLDMIVRDGIELLLALLRETRGKKERLVQLLETIQLTHRRRRAVFEQLLLPRVRY